MYSYFLLRGRRALLREVVAAWVGLTTGSVLFGIVFAGYSASMGEGAAFVAALVLSVPVAAMLLQSVRTGQLRLPDLTMPKGTPSWKMEESESFSKFWKSIGQEEKEGLQWLTSLIVTHALTESKGAKASPLDLNRASIVELEEKLVRSGQEELIVKIKGEKDKFVVVMVDRKQREIHYSVRMKDAL